MMPHIPGPPGTLFNNDQRGVVAWYLTWQESYGYCMWHNYYDYQVSKAHDGFYGLVQVNHFLDSMVRQLQYTKPAILCA